MTQIFRMNLGQTPTPFFAVRGIPGRASLIRLFPLSPSPTRAPSRVGEPASGGPAI